jgi:hypothetical protein
VSSAKESLYADSIAEIDDIERRCAAGGMVPALRPFPESSARDACSFPGSAFPDGFIFGFFWLGSPAAHLALRGAAYGVQWPAP